MVHSLVTLPREDNRDSPPGNTVVCKPSEMTSVTAWMLCKIMKDIGLPPGVVNMVFGYGTTVGESIVTHPEVKIVSFTGLLISFCI